MDFFTTTAQMFQKIKKEFTEKLRTETKDVIEYQLSLDYYSDLAFFIDGESKKTAGKSGEITLRYPDVINSLTDDEREKEQDLALKTITFSKSWEEAYKNTLYIYSEGICRRTFSIAPEFVSISPEKFCLFKKRKYEHKFKFNELAVNLLVSLLSESDGTKVVKEFTIDKITLHLSEEEKTHDIKLNGVKEA